MEARSAEGGRTWNRAAVLGLLLLLALGIVWRLAWVHPWYEATEETNDASMYLVCAKALLAGEGYSYLGEPFTVRPPGFSILLAPLMAWKGLDFALFNTLGWIFGLAGVVLLYALLLPRTGVLVACATAAALALNPSWQHMSNQVMTDVPGVTLALGCLLVERWAARKPSVRRDALLGLGIALSAYVRTANALLAPAIVLARLVARWRAGSALSEPAGAPLPWRRFVAQRLLVVPLVVAALHAPWSIRCSLRHPEPPVDQNYLFSYGTGLWHADPADPASPRRPLAQILERVPLRAGQILPALGGRMQRHDVNVREEREGRAPPAPAAHVALGVVLLAALGTLLVRRTHASEVFALLVLGVLLVYFGFRDRLVTPVFVLSALALVELVLAGLARWAGVARARLVTAALVLACGVLDSAPREDWPEIEARHAAYLRDAAHARELLPEGARVASTVGWHWSVYLDRPVYSLIFGYRRRGGVAGLQEVVARRGIDHVLFARFLGDERGLLPLFQAAHGAGTTRDDLTVVPLR